MAGDCSGAFAALKPILQQYASRATVKANTPSIYTLDTKSPSPFPQHKGQPLFLASVRLGKAYVSFHLMPLYMCPELAKAVTPGLKKRMQGKTCFNFKSIPDPSLLVELQQLTAACVENWANKKWL